MSDPSHTDPAVHSIVLFDGVCNLCNGVVRFLLPRDRKGRFVFGSLQSDAGQDWLEHLQLPKDSFETFVLVEDGRPYLRSTAALRIARGLGAGWPLLYAFIIVPRPIRDSIYSWIARNRYRWFGQLDSCPLPTVEDQDRFL